MRNISTFFTLILFFKKLSQSFTRFELIYFFTYLLTPISKAVILFNLLKRAENLEFSGIKLICVGNIYLGGTGKTPLSIKISQLLNKRNFKSTVIKKFYNEQQDEQILISNKIKRYEENLSK